MFASRLALVASLLLTAPVVGATPARAEPPARGAAASPDAAAQVTVEAWLVRASRGEANVDERLRGIARDLSALPYGRFEVVAAGSWRTRPGGTVEGTLGGKRITVEVQSVDEGGASLVVEVTEGGRRVTRTSVHRPLGRAHVLSVGSEGGAALVLPVRVVR